MSTKKVFLSATPVQITDGSNKAFVQSVAGGEFYFADSDASPDVETFMTATELSVAEGFSIWAWTNANNTVTLVVATSS